MQLKQLKDEALRIMFGIESKYFRYTWSSASTRARLAQYQLTAVQRAFGPLGLMQKQFWPLCENTLQLLDYLKGTVFPIFQIPFNTAEAVELCVQVKGNVYNVRTDWDEIVRILNLPESKSLTEIPIILTVNEEVYRTHIEPFLPSPQKSRVQQPRLFSSNETLEEVYARLTLRKQPVAAPTLTEMAALKIIVSELFVKPWVPNERDDARQAIFTIPQGLSPLDVALLHRVLIDLLKKFNLYDYFTVYGSMFASHQRTSINLTIISFDHILLLCHQSSAQTPLQFELTFRKPFFESSLAEALGAFQVPNEVDNYMQQLERIVAANLRLKHRPIDTDHALKIDAITEVNSDEEDDVATQGDAPKLPVFMSVDLRGHVVKRREPWFQFPYAAAATAVAKNIGLSAEDKKVQQQAASFIKMLKTVGVNPIVRNLWNKSISSNPKVLALVSEEYATFTDAQKKKINALASDMHSALTSAQSAPSATAAAAVGYKR